MNNLLLQGYAVTLRPIQSSDLEQLRQWRNSEPVRQQMLSQQTISVEQQNAWFSKVQRDPAQHHWVIEYKSRPIGSANIKALYASKLDEATTIEPGLYIGDPAYRQNIIAFAPTLLINDYCFNTLAASQLKAVVKASNQAAMNYNIKLGYKVHSNHDVCELILTKPAYEQATAMLKQLLSRN